MHIYTMIQELNRLFPTGTRISNKELKIRLQQLYNKYVNDAVATAVDITRFGYNSKAVKIPTDKGKFNGLELTIIKQYNQKLHFL